MVGNEKGVTGMCLKNVLNNETKHYDVNGIFIAIGHKPNSDIFLGQLDMDQWLYQCKKWHLGNATATSIPGVFAAGDVTDYIYRQAITSAGTGCMAALDAEKYLEDA